MVMIGTTFYPREKVEAPEGTAEHQTKIALFEDTYVKRWQACVNFGKWITADESRCQGWYNSCMTVGPEPKPIRTGASFYSAAVTYGALAGYKLFARCYGGQNDGDLSSTCHENCVSDQKFVNLFDIMLHLFKSQGRCVTCDPAYMSDIMAQIS